MSGKVEVFHPLAASFAAQCRSPTVSLAQPTRATACSQAVTTDGSPLKTSLRIGVASRDFTASPKTPKQWHGKPSGGATQPVAPQGTTRS